MLRILIPGLVLSILSTAAGAQQPPAGTQAAPAPAPDRAKVSYALGMDIGGQMKRQGIDLDPAIFAKAVADAVTGAKPEMTPEEMRAVIVAFQAELTKKQTEATTAARAKNQQEGEAFLAANKSKEGVVTLPSGLQYKIVKQGTGPKPAPEDSVECHYRGTLVDGTEFDSSYKRNQPATFRVGGVIPGWTEALRLMPVGSKWELYVPPALGYGERGAGQLIGPNATLIFEVELLSIKKIK